MDEWHSRQSHKRTFGVPDCVNCAAIPLIKECNTAMSAIRKRVFTLLKNEHTESCEINQLLAYEQPNTYIVVNDEYSADTTLTPVLTANKGFVLGYTDEDFDRAKAVQERNGKYYKALYDQAGNSIAVPIFESIFRKIILQEVA